MKLISFQPIGGGLSLIGLRAGQLITFKPGEGSYADWRVHVRGPSVYLVSPPGWEPGRNNIKPLTEPRRVYEIPRTACHLGWDIAPGDKLDTRDWSPPCDDCGAAITLAEHLVCAKCAKKREDFPAPVPAAIGAVEQPTEPRHDATEGTREVVILADVDADDEEIDELPIPTRTRKPR